MALRVLEIFDSFQGEGFWTGIPMTFVRLAGCNAPELGLGCTHWCDTPETWDRGGGERLEVNEVLLRVCLPRLCLTGGEPLLQEVDVARLASEARVLGMRVHLETNGTLDPPLAGAKTPDGRLFDWVTVSPKAPLYDVAAGWEGLVDELKLVVDEHLTGAIAERVVAGHPGAVVSIQPVGSVRFAGPQRGVTGPGPADQDSVERAKTLVMDHPEWRLSPQMHKYLGVK